MLNSAYYGVKTDSERDFTEIAFAKAELAATLETCTNRDRFYVPPSEVHLGPNTGLTLFDIAIMSDSAEQTERMAARREIEKTRGGNIDGVASMNTALNMAAFYESANSARVLLDLGYNPNARDDDLRTPLHHVNARSTSGLEIIRDLVASGADVEASSLHGVKPVATAYYLGDLAKAQCLILAGASAPSVAELNVYSIPEARQDDVEAVAQFLNSDEKSVPAVIRERCLPQE